MVRTWLRNCGKNDEILAVKTISRREKDYIPTTIPGPNQPETTEDDAADTPQPAGG